MGTDFDEFKDEDSGNLHRVYHCGAHPAIPSGATCWDCGKAATAMSFVSGKSNRVYYCDQHNALPTDAECWSCGSCQLLPPTRMVAQDSYFVYCCAKGKEDNDCAAAIRLAVPSDPTFVNPKRMRPISDSIRRRLACNTGSLSSTRRLIQRFKQQGLL